MATPREIRYDEKHVYLTWSDGHEGIYTGRRLREECPCAVCKGERGIMGQVYLPASRIDVPADVRVVKHSLVGRYAISFTWSDGHSTGIYPFDYLLELCECDKCPGKSRRPGSD